MRPPSLLTITHPSHPHHAAYRSRFTGTLTAPPGVGGTLQLFVLARDKQWYLQADPAGTSQGWEAICCLGRANGPSGHSYMVAAVLCDPKVTTSPLAALPEGPTAVYRVRRMRE